jgi:hypothetical protein
MCPKRPRRPLPKLWSKSTGISQQRLLLWKALIMRANQILLAATVVGTIGTLSAAVAEEGTVAQPRAATPVELPIEGELPRASATEWLNSPPLTAAEGRGKVALVDSWTYSCINWRRSLPYVRAWAALDFRQSPCSTTRKEGSRSDDRGAIGRAGQQGPSTGVAGDDCGAKPMIIDKPNACRRKAARGWASFLVVETIRNATARCERPRDRRPPTVQVACR